MLSVLPTGKSAHLVLLILRFVCLLLRVAPLLLLHILLLYAVSPVGKSGHGCCEELGISRKEVDCTIVDLAMSFGTIGGFCIGDLFVVDHQRLSGVGYIYSASQPPYLATAAIKGG